jgi:tRNA threonylcarbamoyladenosine biosynthesis protein TsaE
VSAAVLRELTHTAAATEALGARLARALPLSGLAAQAAVLYLCGDLGAGKTTLARGFLHALGWTGPVRSPTYTLLETYALTGAAAPLTAVHLDLYRLAAPEETEMLGLRELARPQHVWLVEWPERATGAALAPADLQAQLTVRPEAHEVNVTAASPFGQTWLQQALSRS